jgi:hypothetical protein
VWHAPQQPDPDSVRADERAAYDAVIDRQISYGYLEPQPGYEVARARETAAGPYFGALLASPIIAYHLSELGAFYRSRGETPDSFAHKDREWIDIVLGHEIGFNMWPHTADGMAVGVRPEAIVALYENRDEDLLPDERLLADYIRAYYRGNAGAAMFRDIVEHFGSERTAIEWIAFIGHLMLTLSLCQAFTEDRTSDEEIVERVKGVIAGTQPLPDPSARVVAPTDVGVH